MQSQITWNCDITSEHCH